MKIRMKTSASCPEWSASAGDIVDLPDAVTAALLNGGYAEAIKETQVETATADTADIEVAKTVDPGAQAEEKQAKRKGWKK